MSGLGGKFIIPCGSQCDVSVAIILPYPFACGERLPRDLNVVRGLILFFSDDDREDYNMMVGCPGKGREDSLSKRR